jgi:hypothetical protein
VRILLQNGELGLAVSLASGLNRLHILVRGRHEFVTGPIVFPPNGADEPAGDLSRHRFNPNQKEIEIDRQEVRIF